MNNISLQSHENNIRLLIRKSETTKFDEVFSVYDHDLKYNVDENSERDAENDKKTIIMMHHVKKENRNE